MPFSPGCDVLAVFLEDPVVDDRAIESSKAGGFLPRVMYGTVDQVGIDWASGPRETVYRSRCDDRQPHHHHPSPTASVGHTDHHNYQLVHQEDLQFNSAGAVLCGSPNFAARTEEAAVIFGVGAFVRDPSWCGCCALLFDPNHLNDHHLRV